MSHATRHSFPHSVPERTRIASPVSIAIMVALLGLAHVIAARQAHARSSSNIDDLAFLAGHWVGGQEPVRIEEIWSEPAGGIMLATSTTVTPGKPSQWEFLRIAQRGDHLVLLASPGGATPTAFELDTLEADRVSFVNPDHDFPQRVTYRRSGNTLSARVESTDGERGFDLEWRLQTRRCE